MSKTPISPLRTRMIEDMSVRKFGEKTQNDYIRHVKTFSTFLGRSPTTATPGMDEGARNCTKNTVADFNNF
jgi:integrase/recombinase XerD